MVSAVLFYRIPAVAADGDVSTVTGTSTDTVWSIYAQTGYQHIFLHVHAPFDNSNAVGVELFTQSPLDLRLHGADLWVSGIGARVHKGRFSGFLEWNANKPRDTEVTADSEPFWAGYDQVEWNDCHVKWWSVNGGVGVDITKQFVVQAGLKYESLYMGLHDPVDRTGLIPYFQDTYGDHYEGYLESKLLLPWIGVQFHTSRLNSSVRFSPYAYTDLKIPFTYYFVATPVTATEHQDYSLKHSGFWLEGNLAYDIYQTTHWSCTLWTQVSWLWTDGSVSSDYEADIYSSGIPIAEIKDSASENDSRYNTGNVAVGLRIRYSF